MNKCNDCGREEGNCKEYCSAQYEDDVSGVPFATLILLATFAILWVVL